MQENMGGLISNGIRGKLPKEPRIANNYFSILLSLVCY